jgi:hypothetical protein
VPENERYISDGEQNSAGDAPQVDANPDLPIDTLNLFLSKLGASIFFVYMLLRCAVRWDLLRVNPSVGVSQ